VSEKERIRELEARLAACNERERIAVGALETAASLVRFDPSLSRLESREPILREIARKVHGIMPCKVQGFLLFKEGDNDLVLEFCQSGGSGESTASEEVCDALWAELETLIADGTVAWAMGNERHVFVRGGQGADILLHALSTPARVRGLFCGMLEDDRFSIPDAQFPIVSIVMQLGAQMLESFELYSLRERTNSALRSNVQALEQAREELQGHRERLEEEVLERTAALEQANAMLRLEVGEREQARNALRDKEATLRAIFDASSQFIFLLSPEGDVLDCNKRGAAVFGLRPGDLRGRNVREVMETERAVRVLASLNRAVALGRSAGYQETVRGRHFEGRFHPVRGAHGRIDRVAVFSQDVTARKLAQETLRQSERRYRSLFEDSPTPVWEIDLSHVRQRHEALRQSGVEDLDAYFAAYPEKVDQCLRLVRVLDVNRATLGLFDARDRSELLGFFEDFFTGQGRDLFRELLCSQLHGLHCFRGETRFSTLRGDVVHAIAYATVVSGHEADLGKVIVSMLDISRRKEMEVALLEAKEQAEAASKAKSAFLANMSHELRTPLNGVLGMIQMLLDMENSEEQQGFLEIVEQTARHMLRIVNDLLDLSSIDRGSFALTQAPFALRSSLHSVFAVFETQARGKGLDFDVEIAESIPERLRGDVARFKQVLINLLSNAVKFTEHGRIAVRIEEAEGEGQEGGGVTLVCSVHDTGIGIAPEQLDRVFEMFFQGEEHLTKRYRGAGMGLAISRGIVEKMGGRIWVESAPGAGSVFRFSVVLQLDVETAEAVPFQEKRACRPGLRVLVAEDEPVSAVFLGRLLQESGHDFELAVDGAQALEMLAESAFDMLLLDIQMPEVSGLEVAERIRRGNAKGVDQDMPMIAVTALAMDRHREACLAAGMDGVVTKPFTARELLEAMGSALEKRQKGGEAWPCPVGEPGQ
jgi:PAS domain S-box-containing protein